MQVLIISGGSIDTKYALAFLSKREYEYVIAVDKGALFCWENGIRPDLLTGDFDTLSPEILKKWEAQGVPVRRFRPEKDDADIEIALQEAREFLAAGEQQRITHAQEEASVSYVDGNAADHMITILGGTGTRLDHMLGTIYAMAGLGPDYPCELVDAHNRVRLLWPGTYVKERKTCTKSYISLLPIGGDVTGITLQGFKYPLHMHTMTCANTLGVSNELTENRGMISFQTGILACFETRD